LACLELETHARSVGPEWHAGQRKPT
jgi:hypothetical protein